MSDMQDETIRVLLIDDHELFRTGIASLLNAQPDILVAGEAGDGFEGHARAIALEPDLILLDINMPGMNGLDALKLIRKDLHNTKIAMLTVQEEDEAVFQAIKQGATGYILKNTGSEDFIRMVREILAGEAALSPSIASRVLAEFASASPERSEKPARDYPVLTSREHDVLRLVSGGLTDKEISTQLSVSVNTVKSHVRNILAKLQVESRYEAAEVARRGGLNQD